MPATHPGQTCNMQHNSGEACDIPLPMLTMDTEGMIESANIEAQSRLNMSANALHGRYIGNIFGPESEIKSIMQHLRNSGQPISDHGLFLKPGGEPCTLHAGAFHDSYALLMVPEANRQEHNLQAKR